MLCLAAIGFLHRSLDEAHSTILRRRVRLRVRILCAIFFTTFPLIPNSNATFDIAVNTGFSRSSSSRRQSGRSPSAARWATRRTPRRAAKRRARSRRASGSRTSRRAKVRGPRLRVRIRADR